METVSQGLHRYPLLDIVGHSGEHQLESLPDNTGKDDEFFNP
jgi:hypothetical protein